MSVKNPWAFCSPEGSARVTAWGVDREREERYGGRPTGKIYYSRHKEGRRKPMSHVRLPGSPPFFRYIKAGDEHEGGPGESLEHRLFKEAVASITHTRLSLGKHGDHRILVAHAETERKIVYDGGEYFADAFLKFESDTGLSVKWSGDVYVEIHNTHAVNAQKMDEVRRLHVPMIEVPIPKALLYEFDDDSTTDEREESYRQRIKRMLESENGFLAGIVLSDPSSVEHLEAQLATVRETLQVAQAKIGRADVELGGLRAAQSQLATQLASEQATVVSLRANLADAVRAAQGKASEMSALQRRCDDLTASEADLKVKLRKANILVSVIGGVASVLVLLWAFFG